MLILLTVTVALLSVALQQETAIAKWLDTHKFPAWTGGDLAVALTVIWAVLYLLNESWVRLAAVGGQAQWLQAQHSIHAKTAGNIDQITTRLHTKPKVTKDECDQILRSFLARIVEFSRLFISDPENQLRACLHIATEETRTDPNDSSKKIKVLCLIARVYDAPHHRAGKRKTEFGAPLAGTVGKFGKSWYVDDTKDPANAEAFGSDPRYRAVIGFPVMIGNSQVIGVVTMDATLPFTFSKGSVASDIEEGISPILASIALAIVVSTN